MHRFYGVSVTFVALFLVSTLSYGSPSAYNPSDINWYIKSLEKDIVTAKAKLKKFQEDKGYDPQAVKLINEASTITQEVEKMLQDLQTKKMDSSTVLRKMSAINEKRNDVKENLVALGELIPSGPKTFPERCVIYKATTAGDELAKKEGLEQKTGQLEPMGYANHLVLSAKGSTYQLDDSVGVIGSADPKASQSVKQPTPPQQNVTALVDVKTKKVMCVGQPMAAVKP